MSSRAWLATSAAEAKRRQAQTAKALGIPIEKTLDLGNDVSLDLVLIPAGRFIMGTREPVEPDWAALERKILKAQVIFEWAFWRSWKMVMITIVRSVRQKQRPQMSLRTFILMIFALSVCDLGGVGWLKGTEANTTARSQYEAAENRFDFSCARMP